MLENSYSRIEILELIDPSTFTRASHESTQFRRLTLLISYKSRGHEKMRRSMQRLLIEVFIIDTKADFY